MSPRRFSTAVATKSARTRGRRAKARTRACAGARVALFLINIIIIFQSQRRATWLHRPLGIVVFTQVSSSDTVIRFPHFPAQSETMAGKIRVAPAEFFEQEHAPHNLAQATLAARAFIAGHVKAGRRVVFVTSGGTVC
jgi:hypothetical protein